ncbi:TPA: fimbrial protein [Enterobacter hormaechei]
MNKMIKVGLLAAAIGAVSGSAFASDGTITFNGKITDITCTVKVSGGAASNTVTLPTVSTTALKAINDTAGVTPFTVSLDGCQQNKTAYTGTTAKASVYFEPGATIDTTAGTLKNTAPGGATLVDLQVLDGGVNGTPIHLGDAGQLTNNAQITIAKTGATTIPYAVRYHATGATTAGAVTSSVVYDVVYN